MFFRKRKCPPPPKAAGYTGSTALYEYAVDVYQEATRRDPDLDPDRLLAQFYSALVAARELARNCPCCGKAR